MAVKFCPLLKKGCLEKGCEWFYVSENSEVTQCSVVEIAEQIGYIKE
jgi:hypothetical protein